MHIYSLLYESDYRGEHSAPTRESGDPLHNVTKSAYPEDFYVLGAEKAARYYAHGIPEDFLSVSIIYEYKDRPNKSVKVYRAVPKVLTQEDADIPKLQSLLSHYTKFGFFPVNDPIINQYEEITVDEDYDERQKRIYSAIAKDVEHKYKSRKTPQISPGDWVTLNKQYAINHGKETLNNNYRVLTKTVKARELFTNGDSVHEWGYDP